MAGDVPPVRPREPRALELHERDGLIALRALARMRVAGAEPWWCDGGSQTQSTAAISSKFE